MRDEAIGVVIERGDFSSFDTGAVLNRLCAQTRKDLGSADALSVTYDVVRNGDPGGEGCAAIDHQAVATEAGQENGRRKASLPGVDYEALEGAHLAAENVRGAVECDT
jgi:hypothetical protein